MCRQRRVSQNEFTAHCLHLLTAPERVKPHTGNELLKHCALSVLPLCLSVSNSQTQGKNEGNAGDETAVLDPQLRDTTHRE